MCYEWWFLIHLYSSLSFPLRSLSFSRSPLFFALDVSIFGIFANCPLFANAIFAANSIRNVELDRHNSRAMLVSAVKGNIANAFRNIYYAYHNNIKPNTKWKPQFIYLHVLLYLAVLAKVAAFFGYCIWHLMNMRDHFPFGKTKNAKCKMQKPKQNFRNTKIKFSIYLKPLLSKWKCNGLT